MWITTAGEDTAIFKATLVRYLLPTLGRAFVPSTHKTQETFLGEGESVELNMEARSLYSYSPA